MREFQLSRKVDRDVDRIYKYGMLTFGEAQADMYFNALFDQFELIAREPYLFPVAYEYDPKYRKSPCGADTIFYQILEENTVLIVN